MTFQLLFQAPASNSNLHYFYLQRIDSLYNSKAIQATLKIQNQSIVWNQKGYNTQWHKIQIGLQFYALIHITP